MSLLGSASRPSILAPGASRAWIPLATRSSSAPLSHPLSGSSLAWSVLAWLAGLVLSRDRRALDVGFKHSSSHLPSPSRFWSPHLFLSLLDRPVSCCSLLVVWTFHSLLSAQFFFFTSRNSPDISSFQPLPSHCFTTWTASLPSHSLVWNQKRHKKVQENTIRRTTLPT